MSLQISKYMDFALTTGAAAERLREMTGPRVYPVIVPTEEAPVPPYVVYASNGMREESTKDGLFGDTSTVEVTVFGQTPNQLEAVAQAVREAMEAALEAWEAQAALPFHVGGQRMHAGAEDFDLNHDGYFMSLFYEIDTERL